MVAGYGVVAHAGPVRRVRLILTWAATSCGVAVWTVPAVGLAEPLAPSGKKKDVAATSSAGGQSGTGQAPNDQEDDQVDDRVNDQVDTQAPASDPNAQPQPESEIEGPEPEAPEKVACCIPDDEVPEPTTVETVSPPRVDGAYLGAVLGGGATFVRVNDRETPGAFLGGGGALRVGEAVLPWMTIGLQVGGRAGFKGAQRVYQGGVLVELGFLPVPKYPLSLLAGFGVGGGAVHEQDIEGRAGFGGAMFKAGARYDLFPGVAKRRPNRGGGFSLGPEISWVGFTPAAKGRPMSNTIVLGLWLGYYFGS